MSKSYGCQPDVTLPCLKQRNQNGKRTGRQGTDVGGTGRSKSTKFLTPVRYARITNGTSIEQSTAKQLQFNK